MHRDESDESECQLLVVKAGYNKMVPPVRRLFKFFEGSLSVRRAPDRTLIPTTVGVSIVLLKVVEIEEENHAIEFQYEIIMKWFDNRLTYHNLKQDTSLNALPEVDMKKLWLPLVIYANTDQKLTTRLGMEWEWSTILTVTKEGNFTRSGLETLHEIEICKGGENALTMSQTYTNQFQCEFVLARYPFDTQVKREKGDILNAVVQVCTIEMVVGTLDLKTVSLSPDMLRLEQYKDMTLFQITHHELDYTNASNPDQGLRMLIVMKRKIMSEIMTTFFPSILLTLITFATTFFKQIYFEASLSVNLTTMLVMTTIFISKMESLPPTSATKMIDYWLILCQLVPFAEVVLLTAMEYTREEETRKEEMNGDAMCDRLQVVPTIIVVHPSTPQREKEEKLNLTTNSPVFSLPTLKMIGKHNVSPPPSCEFSSCRDQRSAPVCASLLCLLFWSCCQVLP